MVNNSSHVFPTALRRLQIRQFLVAGIIFIITTFLVIRFHTVQCFLGYAAAAYLIYLAFNIRHDYFAGKIQEVAVRCTGVRYSPVRRVIGGGYTRVSFCTDDETPAFFKFNIPGSVRDIDINAAYIIYFRPEHSDQLLTYIAV